MDGNAAPVSGVSETASPVIKVFSDPVGSTEITNNFEVRPFPLIAGDPLITQEYEQDENRAAFSAQMQSAWDDATQQYEQGAQDLSQEIADWNAQGFGDCVSGIVGFVSSILGGIFG